MSQNSKIEWTHHTANLWHGCTKVHEGCDHCYAETLSKRWGNDIWGNDKPRKEIKSVWGDLDKYQRLAAAAGEVHRVFVGSMMDIFEKPMPLIDSKGNLKTETTGNLRFQFFYRVERGDYPNLLFLLLTKRPSNINKYIFESWKIDPPANVMFGTSPVNQATANTLIPQLLQVNGKRFLSCEPLLGPIDIGAVCQDAFNAKRLPIQMWGHSWAEYIHWVIVGGESGHGARPMHPDWTRSLRDQCERTGIPFLFKQWGENYPDKEHLQGSRYPDGTAPTFDENAVSFIKLGKKKAGRELDGKIHDGFPSLETMGVSH